MKNMRKRSTTAGSLRLLLAALVLMLGATVIGVDTVQAAQVNIDFTAFAPGYGSHPFASGDEDGFHLVSTPAAKVVQIFKDYSRVMEKVGVPYRYS